MARFITALSVRRRDDTPVDLTDGTGRSPVAFHVAVTPDAPIEMLRTAHADEEPVVLEVELSGVDERQLVTARVKALTEQDDAVDLMLWTRSRRSLLENL
jgi:hypothetical protein